MIPENVKNIKYLVAAPEGQYFDRKSARILPKDILRPIIAFANAGGGIIAIGIEDDGTISGFSGQPDSKINEFKCVSFVELSKTPVRTEYYELPVKNCDGKDDVVLILSVDPSSTRVIRATNGDVFLRYGDKSQKLTFERKRPSNTVS